MARSYSINLTCNQLDERICKIHPLEGWKSNDITISMKLQCQTCLKVSPPLWMSKATQIPHNVANRGERQKIVSACCDYRCSCSSKSFVVIEKMPGMDLKKNRMITTVMEISVGGDYIVPIGITGMDFYWKINCVTQLKSSLEKFAPTGAGVGEFELNVQVDNDGEVLKLKLSATVLEE